VNHSPAIQIASNTKLHQNTSLCASETPQIAKPPRQGRPLFPLQHPERLVAARVHTARTHPPVKAPRNRIDRKRKGGSIVNGKHDLKVQSPGNQKPPDLDGRPPDLVHTRPDRISSRPNQTGNTMHGEVATGQWMSGRTLLGEAGWNGSTLPWKELKIHNF
jgi:hypothetical protein